VIGFGIFALQGSYFVNRDHRNPGMDGADNLGPIILANSICKSVNPAVQVPPKRNALGICRGLANGTEARDMLDADLAGDAAAFRDADLQPDLKVGFDAAEAGKHA
jgi:hypothetical protein